MSHEVEQMAYVGETPWHGIGTLLTPGQSIETWRQQSGLHWSVHESPVYYYIDDELTRVRCADTRKVLYRSDTQEPLSVVSKQYKVVQPAEILEFYRDLIADYGFQLETAGSLKGGQKIWALANTGDSAFLASQDEVRSYLLLATSYDGTFATTAQFTGIRVVCRNTLQMSLNRRETGAIKIGHREDFNPIEVKNGLGLSRERFEAWRMAAEQLTRIKLDAIAAGRLYAKALGVPEDPEKGDKADRALAAHFTETFMAGSYIGSDLEAANGTAWGAVSVVTEYFDHMRRENKPGNRLHNAWFGSGAAVKQSVFHTALELA